MISRAFLAAALICAPLAFADAATAQTVEGQCGGSYVGQDRASYPCAPIRKPVCQQSTGRCQCLERRECGGKQDEEW